MTHLVGGHFIGTGSLARLAGISLTRKIFPFCDEIGMFSSMSSKVSVFNLSLRIIKKDSIESNTAVALTDCKQSGHV